MSSSSSAITERMSNVNRTLRRKSAGLRADREWSTSSSSSRVRLGAFLVFALTAGVMLLMGDADSRVEASYLRSQRLLEEDAERDADGAKTKERVLAMRTAGDSVGTTVPDETERENVRRDANYNKKTTERVLGMRTGGGSFMGIILDDEEEDGAKDHHPGTYSETDREDQGMARSSAGNQPSLSDSEGLYEKAERIAVARESRLASQDWGDKDSRKLARQSVTHTVSVGKWDDVRKEVTADRGQKMLSAANERKLNPQESKIGDNGATLWNPQEPKSEEGWRKLEKVSDDDGAEAKTTPGRQ